MSPRKSIKGNTNKQIAISSSKPKKRKHQSGELDDTIFSKSKKKKRPEKWPNLFIKILMIAVRRVYIISYFLPTQSSFQKGKSIDYHLITSRALSNGGPTEFKVSGSGRNFSILHDHICISYLRYQRQIVLIQMVQARHVLQTTLLQVCSIKWTSFWVVN